MARPRVTEPAASFADISPDLIEEHVIEGGHGGVSRDGLKEIWQYREVMFTFARRRVMVRYKQAVFGVAWAVIQPLLASLVFAVFLRRISRVVGDVDVPYFSFALIGMVLWTYFSNLVIVAMGSVIVDAFLMRKVYFPREILPLSALLSGLFDLAPMMMVALSAAVATRRPGLVWLALPVPILLASLFGVALGLVLSAMNVYYRDVGHVVPFLMQVALFASSVLYPLSAIPARWRFAYSVLNPIASAIDGLRRVLLHGKWPDWGVTSWAFAWAAVLLWIGYVIFKRLERGFADRV